MSETEPTEEEKATEFLRRTSVDGGPEKREGEQAPPTELPAESGDNPSPATPPDEEAG